MATEENSNPPPLPQYPELIISAIEAVDDKNGANKTTISKHIESIYGQLPAAHTTLLSHHLNRMKQSGQLIMLKNNYLKPDPNAPPRRGRGRPPKVKASSSPEAAASDAVVASPRPPAADAVVASPRGRGRPPKAVDPEAPAPVPKTKSPTPSVSGRKRGRPRKTEKSSDESPKVAATETTSAPTRGRGRPPKVKPAATALVGA